MKECKIPTLQIKLAMALMETTKAIKIMEATKTIVATKMVKTIATIATDVVANKWSNTDVVATTSTKENIEKKTTVASANAFVNFLEIGIFKKR